MRGTTFTLGADERILAVVPMRGNAPNWMTHLVVVIIGDEKTSRFRREYIQLTQMSDELIHLFNIGAVVCDQLRDCVDVKAV